MVIPKWISVLIFLTCWPAAVLSQPRFALNEGGVVVTLTDDACELKDVSNLPYKATWEEKGQTYQGCWGIAFDKERVNLFFTDKSVVSFHPAMFKKVTGV